MTQYTKIPFFTLIALLFATPCFASNNGINAHSLSIVWILPFVGMLLSLALMPIIAPDFWHKNDGKVALCWAALVIIPMALLYGVSLTMHEIVHVYLLEYIPFIIIAGALYVIAGGICVQLKWTGTPQVNTVLLLAATLVASWIGTTGAAMLFIRPLIRINAWRSYKTHLMIFFIILVCNLGGCLTALGDPPLFLGFLLGVDFFWPLFHLAVPFVYVSLPVLVIFYVLDRYHFSKEDTTNIPKPNHDKLRFRGRLNFILLLGVMAAVIISGKWDPGVAIDIYGVPLKLQNFLRDITLLLLALISLVHTSYEIRNLNHFTWLPIVEVAKIFAAIFITAMPVLAILGIGEEGALAPLVQFVTVDGAPVNYMYFWMTGVLSGFLDNAPTYLVFFHLAGGDAQTLMGPMSTTLTAISAGAVFMGALTYIGNAPNFMVKSIAETRQISMPSFFGYLLWSSLILLPLFAIMSWLLF
ncbi:MAG: sodium:proton antiporter [Pseudomonadota bacterium]